jgi:hypothetical protein
MQPSTLPLTFASRYAVARHVQLGHLLLKDLRCYWRTPDYNATRMLISLGVALIFGSMYWMRAKQRCGRIMRTHDRVLPVGSLFERL